MEGRRKFERGLKRRNLQGVATKLIKIKMPRQLPSVDVVRPRAVAGKGEREKKGPPTSQKGHKQDDHDKTSTILISERAGKKRKEAGVSESTESTARALGTPGTRAWGGDSET